MECDGFCVPRHADSVYMTGDRLLAQVVQVNRDGQTDRQAASDEFMTSKWLTA